MVIIYFCSRVGLRPLTKKPVWGLFSRGLPVELDTALGPVPTAAKSTKTVVDDQPHSVAVVCMDMGRVEWDAAVLKQRCDDAVSASMKCM